VHYISYGGFVKPFGKNRVLSLLCPNLSARSLPGGRKTLGIIEGDAVPQEFIPKLIKLYQAGAFPFDRLITFYGFDEINRAIAGARRGDTIKPVLRISKGSPSSEF